MSLHIACNLNIPATNAFNWCTIKGTTRGFGKYIRQMGGPCSFGVVELSLEPFVGASQLLLEWQVPNEQIPLEYVSGVIAGVRQAAQEACTEHVPLIQIKVTIVAGNYHPVDSHNRDYKVASFIAFKEALKQAEIIPIHPELEHLGLYQQAVAAWNAWRAREPNIQPDLSGADLRTPRLRDALLHLSKQSPANLSQIDPSTVNLVEVDLTKANLEGANLGGADLTLWDLSGATLTGANLGGANLTLTRLSDVNLSGVNLAGATFAATDFSKVMLARADLHQADLRQINLCRKNLQGTNLEGANLRGANLEGANLEGANLQGANLSKTNLRGAHLTDVRIDRARFHQSDLRGIPWFLIVQLTHQPEVIWRDVLYDC